MDELSQTSTGLKPGLMDQCFNFGILGSRQVCAWMKTMNFAKTLLRFYMFSFPKTIVIEIQEDDKNT